MNFTKGSVYRGVFAATLTPLKAELEPDLDRLIDHCHWLFDRQCDGIGVLGTTGEANSFSVKERLEIISAVGNSNLPKDRLMIGTGTCAEPDTINLTRASLEAGVNTVLMLPPFYYKGLTDIDLATAFARVIERVAEHRLRIILYHFPALTGVPITPGVIEKLLRDYPDTLVGMKDSSGDLKNMLTLLNEFPGFGVYSGTEKHLLPVLQAGGPGCISATVNITSVQAASVVDSYDTSQTNVQELQEKLVSLRQIFDGLPLVPSLKETMASITGYSGWRLTRPPLGTLEGHTISKLSDALLSAGLDFS